MRFLLCLCLCVAGCSSQKDKISGEREPIFVNSHGIELDVDADNIRIDITAPIENVEWTQTADNPTHVIPHVSAPFIHRPYTKIPAGEGGHEDKQLLFSPVIYKNTLVTMDSTGHIRAYDSQSLTLLWDMATIKNAPYHMGGGLACGNARLFAATPYGELLCIDIRNGNIIWKKAMRYAPKSPLTYAQNILLFVSYDNKTVAINARTGNKIWHHQALPQVTTMAGGAAPAVSGSIVFSVYSSGEVAALQIENGKLHWKDVLTPSKTLSSTQLFSQIKAHPVLYKGVAYAISQSGVMASWNLRTGQRIWEKEISGINTPIISGNVLYIITAQGQCVCMTHEDGRVLWVKSLGSFVDKEKHAKKIIWSGPLLAGHKLIAVSSTGKMVHLDPITGAIHKTVDLEMPTFLLPIVARNTLYLLQDTGTLLAFQ